VLLFWRLAAIGRRKLGSKVRIKQADSRGSNERFETYGMELQGRERKNERHRQSRHRDLRPLQILRRREVLPRFAGPGRGSNFINRKYGLEVVVVTHPIPQKYFNVHSALGTWNAPEWKEYIKPTLADEKTRLAYD
jgi:hypothetical protein